MPPLDAIQKFRRVQLDFAAKVRADREAALGYHDGKSVKVSQFPKWSI